MWFEDIHKTIAVQERGREDYTASGAAEEVKYAHLAYPVFQRQLCFVCYLCCAGNLD